MKTILAPVDFSSATKAVVAEATALARALEARVVLLSVIQPPVALPEYAAGFGPRLYTSLVTATVRGSAHILTLSEAAKADIVKYLDVPAEMVTPTYLAADEASGLGDAPWPPYFEKQKQR